VPRRGACAGALAVLIALAAAWPAGAAPAAGAARLVRLTAGFDRGARLGGSTALQLGLRIDTRRAPAPVTELRLLYPKGLGLASSGLGLAACVRPASDFEQVLIGSSLGLAGCSPNAVLGYGTAIAHVQLGPQTIPEYATLSVLAGPFQAGSLSLVVFVDGDHPFGAKLAYAGSVSPPSGRFGGALAVRIPAIPSIADIATVSLADLQLSIGSRAITYYAHVATRTGAYHPDGIGLPTRCPAHGFRFRARLTFQDRSHAGADTIVPCTRVRPAAGG
jgi:hypothetical protein